MSEPIANEIPNQGRGKIARYPREQRDEICQLIRDGAPYAAIIKRCEAMRAEGLTQAGTTEPVEVPSEVNLTNFKNSPLFRQWTRHIERIERDRAKKQFGAEYVKEVGGSEFVSGKIFELQSELFEVMDNFDFEVVGEHLALKPEEMPAFLNAMARLSERTLGFDKYRDQVRAAREAIEKTLHEGSNSGGISAATMEKIERELKLL